VHEEKALPRICAVQNAYNLLCRTAEIGLFEFAARSAVPVIAYSPLAMGVLTGKYLYGARPSKARLTQYPHPRYTSVTAYRAVEEYRAVAERFDMTLAELALRFIVSQPRVASLLVAASDPDQLRSDLDACDRGILEPAVLAEIARVHDQHPNPGP
jgi:aryl-alcohol dehydrogenase-like predicted oxidoreductase